MAGIQPTIVLLVESTISSLIIFLIITPVIDCNSVLEIMLKFEFIYILLIFMWLEHSKITEYPKVIALVFLIAVCCESVAGLTILMVIRNLNTENIHMLNNNKLRG